MNNFYKGAEQKYNKLIEQVRGEFVQRLQSELPIPLWMVVAGAYGFSDTKYVLMLQDQIAEVLQLKKSILPNSLLRLWSEMPLPSNHQLAQKCQALFEATLAGLNGSDEELFDQLTEIFSQVDELTIRAHVLNEQHVLPSAYFPREAMSNFVRAIVSAAKTNWQPSSPYANPQKLELLLASQHSREELPQYQPEFYNIGNRTYCYAIRIGQSEGRDGYIVVTDRTANAELSDLVLSDSRLLRYLIAGFVGQEQLNAYDLVSKTRNELHSLFAEHTSMLLEIHQMHTVFHFLQLLADAIKVDNAGNTRIDCKLHRIDPKTGAQHIESISYRVELALVSMGKKQEQVFKFSVVGTETTSALNDRPVLVSPEEEVNSLAFHTEKGTPWMSLGQVVDDPTAPASAKELAHFILGLITSAEPPVSAGVQLTQYVMDFCLRCAELRSARSLAEFLRLSKMGLPSY